MDDQTSPPPSMTPPPPVQTEPYPEKPPSWPTVFGVIGIILASLGLLGGCCNIGAPIIGPMYVNWLKGMQGVTEAQIQATEAGIPPAVWAIPAGLISLVVSVILMVGAIRILRRKASGVPLYKFWAWFTIPWSLLGFLVGLFLQLQAPKVDMPGAAIGQYIGLAFGGCWVFCLGLALPLFVLYWFTKEPVQAEIVRWDEEWRGVI